MMWAVTVRQPWASLIVAGLKHVETRAWRTGHRGPLLIHAGATFDRSPRALAGPVCAAMTAADLCYSTVPTGALIGQVDVVDSVPVGALDPDEPPWGPRAVWTRGGRRWREQDLGDFSPGRHAWLLGRPRRARVPVPLRGRQGLWRAPRIDLA